MGRGQLMTKNFDDEIKRALMEGTDSAPGLKEGVWKGIENELNNEKGVIRLTGKRKYNRPSLLRFGAIAAVFVLMLLTTTQYGQAAINKIKILLDPQKKIIEQIEGDQEEKEYVLKEGQMGYVIYIDQTMYTKEALKDKDRIVPINKAEDLPEMFIEVSQVENRSPSVLASEMESKLKDEFKEFKNYGKIDDPLKAIHLFGATGRKFDDLYVNYYLVDNTKGGSFIIKTQYIVEAAEGHGARFYHMLREFKVLDPEDIKEIE